MFVLLFLVLISFVHSAEIIDTSGLEEAVGDVESATEGIKEFTEIDKWEYLGREWREILLNYPVVGEINSLFEKADLAFVILFSRHYSLSIEMLVVFILWIITLLNLGNFLGRWFGSWNLKTPILAFGITLIFAHIQIFNILSGVLFKLIFYKKETWWYFFSVLVLIIAIVVYYFIVRAVGKYLNKLREKRKVERRRRKVDDLTKFKDILVKTSKGVRNEF